MPIGLDEGIRFVSGAERAGAFFRVSIEVRSEHLRAQRGLGPLNRRLRD